ncbi:MAG: hypothetical protein ABR600_08430 [Actinomycetota bacterium]
MRCEAVQRELSGAIHEPLPPSTEVTRHVSSCPRCSRFSVELHRLHQLASLEAAPDVPDLAPVIMRRIRSESKVAPLPQRPRRRGPVFPGRRGVAAAVAAGLVVGFVIGSGGLPGGGGGSSALAAEIPKRLVRAAVELRGYRAVFSITERNWSPRVPVRRFRAAVSFRAPEGFRVDVHDLTAYPSAAWPRNDESLVTDGRRWRISGPNPCPPAELPACHPNTVDRTVVRRPPFDTDTPVPTDVIVPMTVLAAADRVDVVGPDTIDGRATEIVSLAYQDATPLFAYLQFLGSWRPFSPQDRVLVWLDAATWFPVRYELLPARGAERRLWAAQMGIEGDRAGHPVFVAEARSLSTALPPRGRFAVDTTGGGVDAGFIEDAPGAAPTDIRIDGSYGLPLVRSGRFARSPARPYDERMAAYASGLAWATVARVGDWNRRRLFGVGDFAEAVELQGGGVGFYEPATATQPRHLALHTSSGEIVVSTNLSRASLVRMASSRPAQGLAPPGSWLTRRWSGGVIRSGLSVGDAVSRARFGVLLPRTLPPGYGPASAQAIDTPALRAVTLVYRRPAAELDGVGVRLYEAEGGSLPPPQSVAEEAVPVGDAIGRWSADDHVLEWVSRGIYVSLSSPAFDLSTMLRIARSVQPAA